MVLSSGLSGIRIRLENFCSADGMRRSGTPVSSYSGHPSQKRRLVAPGGFVHFDDGRAATVAAVAGHQIQLGFKLLFSHTAHMVRKARIVLQP